MPVPIYILKIFFTASFCVGYISVIQISSRVAGVIRKHGKSLASCFLTPIFIKLIKRWI